MAKQLRRPNAKKENMHVSSHQSSQRGRAGAQVSRGGRGSSRKGQGSYMAAPSAGRPKGARQTRGGSVSMGPAVQSGRGAGRTQDYAYSSRAMQSQSAMSGMNARGAQRGSRAAGASGQRYLTPRQSAAAYQRGAYVGGPTGLAGGGSGPSSKKRKGFPFKIIAIIVGLLLVGALVAYIVARIMFAAPIESIEVTGCNHLTTEEMASLAQVNQGDNLFDVDTAAIESRIEKDAWVEKATVTKQYPSTLKIDVTERQIQAVVEVPSDDGTQIEQWAISSDGVWLMNIPDKKSEAGQKTNQQIYDDVNEVLHIENVPFGVTPKVGARCDDDNVLNALNIIVALTTDLANQVKKVSAYEKESTTITLESGVEIVFGSDSDIRDKERVALKIMEEYPDVVYINVRTPSQPTWRSVT